MKKIETAIKRKDVTKYINEISSIGVFLRHAEDKIIIKNGETVNIEIYDNGVLLFSGDKYELFEKLTKKTNKNDYKNKDYKKP